MSNINSMNKSGKSGGQSSGLKNNVNVNKGIKVTPLSQNKQNVTPSKPKYGGSMNNSSQAVRKVSPSNPTWVQCVDKGGSASVGGSKSNVGKTNIFNDVKLKSSNQISKKIVNNFNVDNSSKDCRDKYSMKNKELKPISNKSEKVGKIEGKMNDKIGSFTKSDINEDSNGWICVDRKLTRKKDLNLVKVSNIQKSVKIETSFNSSAKNPNLKGEIFKNNHREGFIKRDAQIISNTPVKNDFDAVKNAIREERKMKLKEEKRIKREENYLKALDMSRRDTKISFITQESMNQFTKNENNNSKSFRFNAINDNDQYSSNNLKSESGKKSPYIGRPLSTKFSSENLQSKGTSGTSIHRGTPNRHTQVPSAPPVIYDDPPTSIPSLLHKDPPPSYSSVIAADKKKSQHVAQSPSKSSVSSSPKKKIKSKDPIEFNLFNLLESKKKKVISKKTQESRNASLPHGEYGKGVSTSLLKETKKGKTREVKKKRLSTLRKNMMREASKSVSLINFIKILQHSSNRVNKPAVQPILYPNDVKTNVYLPKISDLSTDENMVNVQHSNTDDVESVLNSSLECIEEQDLENLIYNIEELKPKSIKLSNEDSCLQLSNLNIDIEEKIRHPLDYDSDGSEKDSKIKKKVFSNEKLVSKDEYLKTIPNQKAPSIISASSAESECLEKSKDIRSSPTLVDKTSLCDQVETMKVSSDDKSTNQRLILDVESEIQTNSDNVKLNESEDVDPEVREKLIEEIKFLIDPVHSTQFREYCHHIVSPEIDKALAEFVKEVVRFQQNMFQKNPQKAKIKRRYFCGLKEAVKHMHKLKCIIIAPNIQKSPGPGCLDEMTNKVLKSASDCGVPVLCGLNRRVLGKLCLKKAAVSCMGIVNYQGAHDLFHPLLEMIPKAKKQYEELLIKYKKEKDEGTPELDSDDENEQQSLNEVLLKKTDETSTSIIENTIKLLSEKS